MSTLAFNPADPDIRRNPVPLFARLQHQGPVHWSPSLHSWVLTRREDVRQVMLSAALSPDRLRPFYAQMPLPAWVIVDMLGIAYADYPLLKAASDELRACIGSARADDDRCARARQGAVALADCFRDLIATRRKSPGEDFVSRMIAARDKAGQLSEDALVATCRLVPFASHETTTHLLENSANWADTLGMTPCKTPT